MLHKQSKDISGIYYNNKVILAVYKGADLVWQAIRSCFGAGYWINKFPWVDSDAWRNN